MMTLNKMKISLETDPTPGYEIYPVENISQNQSKPASNIALPGKGPRDNIFFQFQGQSADISIDFRIWNDGTDRSVNYTSGTIITIPEQINYLQYIIFDPSLESTWTLEQIQGDFDLSAIFPDGGEKVIIENIDTPLVDREGRKWVEARMDLRIGKGIE